MIDAFFQYRGLLPEFVLGGGILLLLLGASIRPHKDRYFVQIGSFFLICLTLLLVILQPFFPALANPSAFFVVDALSHYADILILCAAAIVLVVGHEEAMERAHIEYPLLVLLAALGMMVMVGARDLLPLYLGLELQNLALCILIALLREHRRPVEAALKFFALGALSSGILLYGFSLLYGVVGATSFDAISLALSNAGGGAALPGTGYDAFLLIMIAMVLVLSGMAFKIGAAPFHMWVPDVYQGTPPSVLAYLATAPKIAAIAVLLRLVYDPFLGLFDEVRHVIAFLALMSMVVGSLAALVQSDIRRLLAYASIAQIGFLLTGLLSNDYEGVGGIFLYMVIYLLSTLAAFSLISVLSHRRRPIQNISELSGLSTTHPGCALVLAVILLTMAGIPPLAGFFAKFSVFISAIAYHPWIIVMAVLMSAVSAFYYLKIIKIMYFDKVLRPLDAPVRRDVMLLVTAVAIFLALFVFFSGPFSTMMISIGQSFVG